MSSITYMQKIVQERGGNIRFIRAVEGEVECWFYLELYPEKTAEYENKIRIGDLNIRDYGRILESDWGAYPPADVVRHMRDAYGFETPVKTS